MIRFKKCKEVWTKWCVLSAKKDIWKECEKYHKNFLLNVGCKKGALFKSNLYVWADRSLCPERRRLNWTMDFLDRWRLLNQVLWGIDGTKYLYLAANSAGRFDHWEAQRCFMWWHINGMKSVWGSWIREGQIKLDVDFARLLAISLP